MTIKAGAGSFSAFEWMLARRYLRARRKEGFISIMAGFSFLGIMLGVATLIIVMAVMNGFREELFDKILGVNGHVVVHKVGEPFTDFDEIAAKLERVPGVSNIFPLIEGQVMVSGPGASNGALVRGMRAEDIQKISMVSGNVNQGSFDGFDQTPSVAIGTRMANKLAVGLGDGITLVNPRGRTTVFGTKPNIKRYKISAIFEIGMSEYDRTIIFMPLGEAQKFFNFGSAVSVLEMLLDDPQNVESIEAPLREAGGPTIQLSNWKQRNQSFFAVLEVERNVMFIILSLIVFVAALNIISGMTMLVKDKSRDIAILRTMGATKGAVTRVFLITGASIGILGTIAGFILGSIVCKYIDPIHSFVSNMLGRDPFDGNIYYLNKLPAEMDSLETASVVAMALVLSVLATVYPSWRASRLDPVEALRYG